MFFRSTDTTLYTNYNIGLVNTSKEFADCRYLLETLESSKERMGASNLTNSVVEKCHSSSYRKTNTQSNPIETNYIVKEEYDISSQKSSESIPVDQCYSDSVIEDFNNINYQKISLQVQQLQVHSVVEHFDTLNCRKIITESDHLQTTDADLLNLLSSEQGCSSIFNNIVINDQIDRLISHETAAIQHSKANYFIENTNTGDLKKVTNNFKDKVFNQPDNGCLKCNHCDSIFSSRKTLRKHVNRHTQERKHPCDICGKSFKYNYEVTAHKRSHQNPSLQCEVCSKMFIHKSHLNVHLKKHKNCYSVKCNICNIDFSSQAAYAKHKSIYHFSLVCDICGLKFSSLSALKEHKKIHEINYGHERNHICNVCGKTYIRKRNLKTHITVHMRSKPYVCKICGKSVSSKVILETHIKMHTGVKDFFCNICNKAFASKEYLTIHHRIHDGNKPYECSICQKTFSQKTSLTVHSRFHTGQRPYKCECGRNFATKSHLMKHYKTHELNVDISYPLHTSLQSL